MYKTRLIYRGVRASTSAMVFGAMAMAFTLACGDSDSKPADGGTDASTDGGGTGGKAGSGGGGGKGGGATGGAGGAGGLGGATGDAGNGGGGTAGGGHAGGGSTGTGGGVAGGGSTGTGGVAGGAGGVAGGTTGGVGGGALGGGTPPTPASLAGWVTGIDFGKTLCGSTPTARTFTLTNSGGTAAKITAATFSGAAGYATDALNKTIPANGQLVVSVTAPAIPVPSQVPGNYQATVTFSTDAPGDTAHAITLNEAASGAILALEAASDFGSFGTVAAGQSAAQTFRIANTGDVAAMLTGTAGAPFSVSSPIAILPGDTFNGTLGFAAGFDAGDKVGTLTFNASTTICSSTVPATHNLTAKTLNGGITLSATQVAIAPVCNGSTPVSSSFSVTNNGNAPITFQTAVANGLVTTNPPSGANPGEVGPAVTVQPGATVPVTLTQDNTVTGPSVLTDQITISTTGITGDTAHTIQVTEFPSGDVVSASSPGGLDIGQVPIISPARTGTLQLVFLNAANVFSPPAQITLTNSNTSLFSLDRSTLSIAPGTSQTVTVTFAPGSDRTLLGNNASQVFNTNIGWTIGTDANCAGPAGESGTFAIQATATAALVAVNPAQLVFGAGGLVNCGAQANPGTITLTNPGASPYTIQNVTLNHPYYFPAVLSGAVVAPGGSQTITVTPRPIPAQWAVVPDGTAAKPNGTFNGTLTFDTDAPNDSTHTIPLFMGAKGVIITGAPPPQAQYNFRDVAVGGKSYFSFTVPNSGNATASATFRALNGSTLFGITPSPTLIQTGLQPGAMGDYVSRSSTVTLFYQPDTASSTDNDRAFVTIAPSTGEVFCQPLPAAWDALGTSGVPVQGSSLGTP